MTDMSRFSNTIVSLEATLVVLVFAFYTGALGPLLFVQDEGFLSDEARDSLRTLTLPVYAITILMLVSRMPSASRVLAGVKANWHLAALIFGALLSVLWSIAPDVTLRRNIALVLTTLFAVCVCERYDAATALKLLAVACGAVTVLSLALVLLFPSLGVSPIDESLRGAFPNKNTLGRHLLLALIVFSVVDAQSGWQRVLRWGGIVVTAAFLWLSHSRGPVIALVALAPLAMLVRSFGIGLQAGITLALSILTGAYVCAAMAFLDTESILGILDRDTTLTGRTELWSLVQAAIMDRPWLGYGYGAFWETAVGPSRTIWELIEWDAPSAHNGYLELWLGIGIFGPIALFASIGTNLRNAIRAIVNGRRLEGRFCIFYLIALGICNLNESDFMEQNSITLIVYAMATIYAQRASQSRSRHAGRRASAGSWTASSPGNLHVNTP